MQNGDWRTYAQVRAQLRSSQTLISINKKPNYSIVAYMSYTVTPS